MAAQKTPSKRPSATTVAEPRVVKKARYQSFRLQKRQKPAVSGSMPGAFRIFRQALGVLARNWKVFLGITIVYTVLNILLVQGLSAGTDVSDAKKTLDEAFSGSFASVATGAALFTYILGSSNTNVTPAGEGYQLLLVLLVSLTIIWALREVYAKHKIRIRDGFYQGIYPLVPFFLVLCVIALQLIPFAIGLMLFTMVSNGIAATWLETALWGLIFLVMALVSLYMVCASVFALYIVCLPDMPPVRALRSAAALVRGRRWLVLRRLLFLPFVLVIGAAVVVIPFIWFATPAAGWAFFVVSMAMLPVAHSYLYGLYRELL